MPKTDIALERGLPVNLDAERLCLGSVLIDPTSLTKLIPIISDSDLFLEKHKRIFRAMEDMSVRGVAIDRVTLANELMSRGQLESCDGITYLVSLDEGLPFISNVEDYARIVKEKAALRRLTFVGQQLVDRCLTAEDLSEEIIASVNRELLGIAQDTPRAGLISTREIIDGYPGGLQELIAPAGGSEGMPTGIPRLDRMTGGLRPGELFVLAARPSMGKSALAFNIAAYVAIRRQKKVAAFSLEMSKESLLQRMICSEARVDMQKARSGYATSEERARMFTAANNIRSAEIYIDESGVTNLVRLNAELRKMALKTGVDLAIVDYLQLMTGDQRGRDENRVQEISQLTRGLKQIAKDLGIPMLVLSQLNRAPDMREDHTPRLSDLRESGTIEQDADVVAFLIREEFYKPKNPEIEGLAELHIAKQRNGPLGKIDLVFLKEFTRFESRTEDIGQMGVN